MAQMEQMRKQLDDAKKDRLGSPKNWNVGFSNPQSEIANMIDIGYWIFIMNISLDSIFCVFAGVAIFWSRRNLLYKSLKYDG
jgi:hypothetical protein